MQDLSSPAASAVRTIERISRPRLERRLVSPSAAPIVILVGPPGSGKSDLVRPIRDDTSTIYYRVGNERRTLARFVHGLAQTLAPVAPGVMASFPRAWERALQSRSPGIVLAHMVCEHLQSIDRPIILDDLHDAAVDASIASFIGKLADLRPQARLTIALRSIGALPTALWMATRRMDRPIDEFDLRFDRLELAAAARSFDVTLDASARDGLLAATAGLPIAVSYALTRMHEHSQKHAVNGVARSFEDIAERIFGRRNGRERDFLFYASLLPTIDDSLLRLCGWDDAEVMRDAMAGDAAFMWERDLHGDLHFHDRFRDYLAAQWKSRDPDFRSAIALRTVESLAGLGRYSRALEIATQQGLRGAMSELLDGHGFDILETGEVDAISDALGAFDDRDQSSGPIALALRGYMEARSGHLDTAEAWFRLGLAKEQDEASRAAIAMYYARELTLRRREDACEALEPFAESPTLPRSMLIEVRSAYAQALTAANRLDEAARRADEAIALLEADSPPALRARVFARAAYVALENDAPLLARERARIAAPLAVAQSLYDVAASAFSVLYNVAYDVDDDATSSLEYLRALRDLGLKSGTLRLDLFGMLAMYELFAEAGDEAALIDLDRDLSAIDKHDATAEIMEGVLPGKALRSAWSGDFDAAQRLLRPTADYQATPSRQALCWAQIRLYCLAAGNAEHAEAALEKAMAAHRLSDCGTTQFALTLLVLALAALVGGDANGARELYHAASDETIGHRPRLRALRDVLEAMIADPRDMGRFLQGMQSALDRLSTVSFGGMAKLIEALPWRFAPTGPETATIGSVLARHELISRMDVLIGSGRPTSLRLWLDKLRDPVFDRIAIPEIVAQWAARRGELGYREQTALDAICTELAGYRRPAPVFLRLVDDVDVPIDALLDQLAVAAPLMAEHSRAVSAWCSRIGRVLGMSQPEITFVTRCGLIHDIGKMRTPADILSAPRGLTPQEWAIMRNHAAEGGEIISRLPALAAFVPVVRGHHERLDGKGYPDGLRSNAIPVAARIVSVADSFNAMIGRRPYRLPLSPTEALSELEQHRGTQFDPEIVAALVQIVLGRLSETPLRASKEL